MRENRLSGLMRGGKQTVIGPRDSQSVASRLLYMIKIEVSSSTSGKRKGRRHLTTPCDAPDCDISSART